MLVAVPGERLAFTPELVPLQEEEREEEQLHLVAPRGAHCRSSCIWTT